MTPAAMNPAESVHNNSIIFTIKAFCDSVVFVHRLLLAII
jgi:hypothetical protein